jgi:hypothetical protein
MIWPGGLGWHPLAHQPPESAAASRILCAIWQHADGGFHLNRIPNNTICLHGSTLPCRKATGFIILHWTQLCLFASRFTTTRPLNPRVILTWRTTTPPFDFTIKPNVHGSAERNTPGCGLRLVARCKPPRRHGYQIWRSRCRFLRRDQAGAMGPRPG